MFRLCMVFRNVTSRILIYFGMLDEVFRNVTGSYGNTFRNVWCYFSERNQVVTFGNFRNVRWCLVCFRNVKSLIVERLGGLMRF